MTLLVKTTNKVIYFNVAHLDTFVCVSKKKKIKTRKLETMNLHPDMHTHIFHKKKCDRGSRSLTVLVFPQCMIRDNVIFILTIKQKNITKKDT